MVEGNFLRVVGASQGKDLPFTQDEAVEMQPELRMYCTAVIQSREKLIIPDATKSEFWKTSAGAKAGFIAYAGVPIFNPDGDIFGSICLFDRKPNAFEGPIIRLMEEFGEIVSSHLSIIAKNSQLEETLKEVRTLQGLIPICAHCKKIRDDKGFWQKVEVYLEERSNARFTHGLCEDCIQKLYGKEKWFKNK